MDIPRELVEQLARGNGVVFVGAGLSQGAGLPNWSVLLSSLAESINLPPHLRVDPLKVAQHYENARGRQALISHIIEQTDATGNGPTDNHRRLLRLGVRTWVTTNYDDLIEQTLHEAGERFAKVVRDQDLPYASADTMTLVKLHGDREQPDTIVITQQDYNTYFRRFPRVKDKLAGLLLEKTFLFVGYSINDPDFIQIQAEIAFDLQQHQRMAYAMLFDADEFTLSDLRSRNIYVLNILTSGQRSYSKQLGDMLDNLIHRVDQAQQQRATKTRPTIVAQTPGEFKDVGGLLEAMGYRITDSRLVGSDLYFLCDAKWGAEIRQEVAHFVGGEPAAGDIAALNDAVISHGAARGILLTRQSLSAALYDLARQRERIQCYALNEFTDRLADFRSYLERLIQEHEASEIPAFYVPLSAESEADEDRQPQVFKPLESFVDTWLTKPGRNHLSILGDFGTGKTWFCQRYAYLAAKRYLADPTHNRIPVLITLRNYSRAYDVEQIITDAIVNRYKVGLAAGYKTFARLNEAGRTLLIFDGFDEMERRVSDYRTTVDNFWELAKIVCPASKVLLTCRTAYFRHRSEEEETLAPRRYRVSLVAGEQVIDLHDRQQFEVMHLLDFTDEDIQSALQKRLPTSWGLTYKKIQELSNLRDLASRPVLLDMIVKTLPQIKDSAQINQATLYAAYVDALLKRRWSEDTDYIPPQDRLFFMKELAWEMYQTQRLSIPFSEFPERVTKHFGLSDELERATFFERDMRTQSYLVRDDTGNYRFAHKSFMEYFVARKLADVIHDLGFDVGKAIDFWKMQPLSLEIRDFLLDMICDPTSLWKVLEATRAKTTTDVGYAGGNAILLLHAKGWLPDKMNLSRMVIMGADLSFANLMEADLRETVLRGVNLSGCVMKGADLRRADLTGIKISSDQPIRSVRWHPKGRYLAFGGSGTRLRVWDTIHQSEIYESRDELDFEEEIWGVTWFPSGDKVAMGGSKGTLWIGRFDSSKFEKIWKLQAHGQGICEVSVAPDGNTVASASDGSTVALWDTNTQTMRRLLTHHAWAVQRVRFDPLGRFLASGGLDTTVVIVRLADLDVVCEFNATSVIRGLSFSHDAQKLAFVDWSENVRIISIPSMQVFSDFECDVNQPRSIEFGLTDDFVAIAGVAHIELRRVDNGELIVKLEGHAAPIWDMSFSPDGLYLASCSDDATIRIWDTDSTSLTFGQCLKMLNVTVNCQGTRISGTKGLDEPAPDGKGTLRHWLVARGAVK
jgi:WD40 repeat protein